MSSNDVGIFSKILQLPGDAASAAYSGVSNVVNATADNLIKPIFNLAINVGSTTCNLTMTATRFVVIDVPTTIASTAFQVAKFSDPYITGATGIIGVGLIAKGVWDLKHPQGNRKIAKQELTAGSLALGYTAIRLAPYAYSYFFGAAPESGPEKNQQSSDQTDLNVPKVEKTQEQTETGTQPDVGNQAGKETVSNNQEGINAANGAQTENVEMAQADREATELVSANAEETTELVNAETNEIISNENISSYDFQATVIDLGSKLSVFTGIVWVGFQVCKAGLRQLNNIIIPAFSSIE